jgi:hypothetical protein
VGTGTTGYTTAKVASLHSLIYASLIRQQGHDKAQLYGQANQAAIKQIATLVDSLSIDCQLTRAPAYTYTVDPDHRLSTEAEVSAAQSLGLPVLRHVRRGGVRGRGLLVICWVGAVEGSVVCGVNVLLPV